MSILTKKNLAKKYGVHQNTFAKWLKQVPELNINSKQRILTPKQVEIIYEALGKPDNNEVNKKNKI